MIERMLAINEKEVMRNIILYWGLIPHQRLLPYYKSAWPEYKNNVNFSKTFSDCLKVLHLSPDYFDVDTL